MHHLSVLTRSGAALVAVGDPSRDRTVYATIVLLVAIGFAMIMVAVWLVRNTRPDPEVLAPLERMGERKWRRADPVWQRRHLDQVRPAGADPLEPTSAPPATDADFERGPQPIGFGDLVASSPTVGAVGSELPAPSAAALPVDGPTDVDADAADADAADGGDEAATGTSPDATVGDDLVEADAGAARVAHETDQVDGEADEAGGQTGTGTDDDDEDITGEQDTDDFFAVLDPDTVGDVKQDADAEPDVEADNDAHADHADPGVDPVTPEADEPG